MLIDNLFNLNWNVKAFGSWDFLLLPILFLIIRFVFSMLSYGSSVPGGIFHAYPSSWGIIGNNLRQYYDKIADYFANVLPSYPSDFHGRIFWCNRKSTIHSNYATD